MCIFPTPRTKSSGVWRTSFFGVLVACGGPIELPDEPIDCGVSGMLCTAVGDGRSGFDGDGRLGVETMLSQPTAIRFDASGQPLFVDFNNLRVRTLDPDGTVRTVAGSGWHAFAIDGSDAVSSPLENAIDVWPAADGGFYLTELHAGRVLHVDSTGWLTVVAGDGELGFTGDGGNALEARFSEAVGLAVGAEGQIFVADTDNHCVRVIDPVSGGIDRVVGDGVPGDRDGALDVGQLSAPQHLDVHDGSLYVADRDNHRVRRIDLVSGIIETVVGTGVAGYSGDGGPAREASLNEPHGVDLAEDGTLWIADSSNHVIRRVDPDGIIETVAGTGVEGIGADRGLALDEALAFPHHVQVAPDGQVWIADLKSHRLRVLRP